MKKIISLVLVGLIFFGTLSLASCDSTNNEDESKSVVSGTVLHFGNSGHASGNDTSYSSATSVSSVNIEESSPEYDEYVLLCNKLSEATRYKMYYRVGTRVLSYYENDGKNKYVEIYDPYGYNDKQKWVYNGVGYLKEIAGDYQSGLPLTSDFLLDFTECESIKDFVSVPLQQSQMKNLSYEEIQFGMRSLSFDEQYPSGVKWTYDISYSSSFSFVLVDIIGVDSDGDIVKNHSYEFFDINDASVKVRVPEQ